jgi:hypothetical protein
MVLSWDKKSGTIHSFLPVPDALAAAAVCVCEIACGACAAERQAERLLAVPGAKAGKEAGEPGGHPTTSPSLQAAFTCHAFPKYFLFHPSHRIFRRMHEVLNVGKKNN